MHATHYAAIASAVKAWFLGINAMLIMVFESHSLISLKVSLVTGFNMQK